MGAGDLKVGDQLKQADGTIGTVTGVQTVTQPKQMYNLSVGVAHTYFVGEMGWLVHNTHNELVTFYTVQTPADAQRLRSGGEPWPNGMSRANMGEGLYSWGTAEEAAQYAARMRAKGVDVETVKLQMTKEAFNKLNGIDLTKMSDMDVDEWMERFSQYGEGNPHGKDYVARGTGMGTEHYFSPDAFKNFWVSCS